MKFEVGKYYKHHKGRSIHIAGQVKTFKWGDLYVVEETDPTGHAISCIEKDSEDKHDNWIEIGKEEFLMELKNVRVN
jgi:hypothetical protein